VAHIFSTFPKTKVKKIEYFPKPGVFSRFFPPIPSKLKQNGKSTPYIGYQNITEDNYYETQT
jgi:hypothetical protein